MQHSMFKTWSLDEHFERNASSQNYKLEELDIGDITFLPGQQEGVHRWYRLTPSFSPSLVRHFIEYFNVDKASMVLDPFAGRGTTLIECQKKGIPAFGFEINPLLHRVTEYSLEWGRCSLHLLDEFASNLEERLNTFSNKTFEETAKILGTVPPDIHNVFRWWKPEVLRDLIVARQLAWHDTYIPAKEPIWLAVNSASIDCANIHRNHPTITFDDDHNRRIDVLESVLSRLEDIRDDMLSMSGDELRNNGLSRVELRDARKILPDNHWCQGTVTNVITSPPYPNRYSYVHQTRPQLHFMEVIETRREATEIDLNTVGGTWGKATSDLTKGLIVPEQELLDILDYFPVLSRKSTLMCNYATKYFLDMDRHISALRCWVSDGFSGAYVVGNSRLKGVEIFTEVILSKLFERNGFKVDKMLVFRKRGGRKRLYETAVVIRV